jgi:predicted HicB family RNase H-like nuclease
MTPRISTFSLRLPVSLKAAVERLAEAEGTSMNQFLGWPLPKS